MTWKTRKERQDEKATVAPNGSEPTAMPANMESDISEAAAKPFIFDLTGNAFRPVSARTAPPAENKTDILAQNDAPAARFFDVPEDDTPPEASPKEIPAPVAISATEAEMPSLAEEDEFVPMPIQATILSPADALPSENVDDKELEPLVMPTLPDAPTMETAEAMSMSSAEDEPETFASLPADEDADIPTFAETPTFDDAEAVLSATTPVSSEAAAPEPETAPDVNAGTMDSEAETSGVDAEMPAPKSEDVTISLAPAVREAVTSSLIYTNAEDGIPRVAPFIVDIPPPAPTIQPAAPTLVVKFGKFTADFPLSRDVTTLGRPDTTTQTYPDIEIELDDTVSRRHAEVVKRGTEFFVVDVGSANGTKLNGEVLEPYQEIKIERGDRIHLGERTEIVVQ